MKRSSLLIAGLFLAGCSGEKGPEGADSMESELQKAAQSAPQNGGEWKPRSAGGMKADGGKRPGPDGPG